MGYSISMNDSEFFVSTENVGRVYAKTKNFPYDFELDDDGNIFGIEHIGHNLGDDLEIFQSIAPYVADGSFLDMSGEDGERWQWRFQNGECRDVKAKIVWEEQNYVNLNEGGTHHVCE